MKCTLKKLILDSSTKTIFSLNGVYYKQTDGVSMGSPLGPTLANIIMTEFETVIVKPLINSGIMVFYKRYVDDTLVLAKPSDIEHILNTFNTFDSQIQFTVDQFPDNDIHFLDIQILPNGILSTASKPILVNTNISQATLHGQERFPGYVPSFIVPTKFVAMMNSLILN
jgi:hypothetical protein